MTVLAGLAFVEWLCENEGQLQMGAKAQKYVAKAVPGVGWRVWNRKRKCWWGNYYIEYPTELLAELNGVKRPDRVADLSRCSFVKKG